MRQRTTRIALALIMAIGLAMSAAGSTPASAAASSNPNRTIISLAYGAHGECLDLWNYDGPWIGMYRCHGGLNQDWAVWWDKYDNGLYVYTIRSHRSGQCIDGGVDKGWQLRQTPCSTGTASRQQKWIMHTDPARPGWIQFENYFNRGQCMDISDQGWGSAVISWDCVWGKDNQLWEPHDWVSD